MKNRILLCLGLLLVLLSLGCGSGDSNENERARVLGLKVDEPQLSLGEESRIDIDFTFAYQEVFDDDRNVIVAVKLPAAVRYLNNSGRVESIGADDDVDPESYSCADGGSLVVFDLDEQDLTSAENPPGDADARLQFDIEAIRSEPGTGTLEARAGYDTNYSSCDSSFFGQEIALITVSSLD